MYIYAYGHIQTHTYMASWQVCVWEREEMRDLRVQTHTNAYIYVYIHARTDAHAHAHTRAHIRTHARTHTRTHARIHTRTRTHARTTHLCHTSPGPEYSCVGIAQYIHKHTNIKRIQTHIKRMRTYLNIHVWVASRHTSGHNM